MAKPEGPVARKDDYDVVICPSKLAADVVRAHHYSKSTSHRALSFCAYHKESRDVAAVVQFLPPLPPASRLIVERGKERGLTIEQNKVIALTRLVVVPGEPQNVASMLVGAALRQLRRDRRWQAVVTFADMRQGHTGNVYRALNAEYLGQTAPETVWIDSEGAMVSRKSTVSRTYEDMRKLGYRQEKSPGKHRFVWWLTR